jgi:membrane associated rhomboid family serine protease
VSELSDQDEKSVIVPPPRREPAILLPKTITALIGVMVAVHLVWSVLLSPAMQAEAYWWFAFIEPRVIAYAGEPGGFWPTLWTPFTHAFLHADWMHLLLNAAWLAIFATPVVRRYGTAKLMALFLVSAAIGAGAFAVTTWPEALPLIGASGGVAGLMGASMRFMFQPVETGFNRQTGERVVLGRRLATFTELAANVRARTFILIWVGINLATPILPAFTGGTELSIAWQAHLGGFFAGLLLVPLLEKRSIS